MNKITLREKYNEYKKESTSVKPLVQDTNPSDMLMIEFDRIFGTESIEKNLSVDSKVMNDFDRVFGKK